MLPQLLGTAFLAILSFLSSTATAVGVTHVGRAVSLNLQKYLQDEIDWDEQKAYIVFNDNIERWPTSGQRTGPENSIPWSKGTANDAHRQFYVHDANRNIHITRYHFTVYSESLSQLYTTGNGVHPITQVRDNTNRFEFDKIWSLGRYSDRFIMRLTQTRNTGTNQ